MELRLTVVDVRGDGHPLNLLVTAPEGATLGELLPLLPQGFAAEPDWYAAGSVVPPDATLGMPPLLQGVCLTNAGSTTERPIGTVVELHVVEGPDSGQVVPLALGRTRVGRSADCELQLHDPSLSRVHAQLQLGHDGIQLLDRGATNGTFVAGVRATSGNAARVEAGQRIRLGGSTVVLRVPRVPPAATQPDGRGHLGVNRGPREQITTPPVRLARPSPPEAPESGRMPVLTLVLPLLLSLVLAYVMDSAVMLLFGLMGPVMMLGSHLSDRRGGRLRHRRQRARHAEDLARFGTDLAGALEQERRLRHRAAPDLAELLVTAREPGARLWHRRPSDNDFLRLRLGSATLPAVTTVTDHDGGEDHPLLDDVPLEVSLPQVGVLGVAGPAPATAACLRGLVGQVAGWHSPRDVRVVVLVAVAHPAVVDDWHWLVWLPHATAADGATGYGLLGDAGRQVPTLLAELGALLDERLDSARRGTAAMWAGPSVVLVLDGARRLRSEAGVARLLREGPSVGVYTICADTQVPRLPAETGATLDLSGTDFTAPYRCAAEPPVRCTPGLVRLGWAERLARHLSALRDATPEDSTAQPPDVARLLEVLDVDATDPAQVRDHWSARPRSTAFVLGAGADSPEIVDLRRDGPHALVGGTTGAGKSELLQTMIASLALANRPDEMVFVLVDYKGGSAFKDCARLPHTVGMVTDLDGHLTARALRSLEAELRRRERVLGAVGAKDLEDHQRIRPTDAPLVPRLVLVIDEFKMLAEDLPDFIDGLVKVAAVGRSLGVHLVLATQRPGGIVSSDIKANVNLRIALRVRDKADSDDVLEDPAAAAISARTPGRALLRTGSGPLRLFQTARVGGHELHDEPQTVSVRPLALTTSTTANTSDPDDAHAPSDLCRIVDAVAKAAVAAGVPTMASPWLPPLRDSVALPRHTGSATWSIPYAVADLPDEQRQETLVWDLEQDGHLAFAGSARSGRTTALRTLAASIAQRRTAVEVHLHAFDGSGGLRAVARLPHAGVVVARDEPARGSRLLQRLLEEVAQRQSAWAEHGYSSLAEQREDAMASGAEPLPYLVIMVDDWDAFTETYDEVDAGRPVEAMHQLLREGPSVGLRVVLTGGRSVLLSRTASLVPQRFCLRMADEGDLLLAGLPAASVPGRLPPGRALRVGDGAELQIAVLPDRSPADDPKSPERSTSGEEALDVIGEERCAVDGSGRAQVRLLHQVADRCLRDPGEPGRSSRRLRPLQIEPLPRTISLTQLVCRPAGAAGVAAAETATGSRHALPLLLGVGGDDLQPVTIDPGGGLSFLVAGPAGSGRTTALELLARQLLDLGRVVAVVAESRSPLAALETEPAALIFDPTDVHGLRVAQQEHTDLVAVVDDVERLAGSGVEEVLIDLVRSGRQTGAGVVCAGMTHELLTQFRGLAVEVRRQQTGLLLHPSSPTDGELFTVRASPLRERLPGRGLHVERGRLTPVQVALPRAAHQT
ncbi:FtsK/SpoIIIE domain-containing protein [Segeticoccus rhizosphaerae]|jgi:S-DNA-T family DNA segregation ATPase FtsK/SpoIIIE|uniref:FtsK/SpoIIIE domain-containing protein n=3 Tax=Segeticoccus rhizosphaerae TaxID=1104777 RepID=UPI0010BF926B|nr:FtsK/SpoIIIE domain-containing protein [Ornithinicoccus soli]